MNAAIHFLVPHKSNVMFLRETLLSIIAQSMQDWKATVFDDSSQHEETRALIESLADPRLDLVSNPTPLGIGGNWNAALSTTRAEFACLVHADDRLASSYASEVLDLHRRFPDTYGVFTGVHIIDHEGQKKRFSAPDLAKRILHPFLPEPCVVKGDKGLRSLLRGDFIFCPTVTYRVSRLIHPVFNDRLRMTLDLLSFAEVLIRGEQFVGTREAHYFYRRHKGSTTSTLNTSSLRFQEELYTYRQIADLAERSSFPLSARTGRRAAIVKAHLLYSAVTSFVCGRFKDSRRFAMMLQT
jgi:glycosyltransferase involved in cell wall biosynthesis